MILKVPKQSLGRNAVPKRELGNEGDVGGEQPPPAVIAGMQARAPALHLALPPEKLTRI